MFSLFRKKQKKESNKNTDRMLQSKAGDAGPQTDPSRAFRDREDMSLTEALKQDVAATMYPPLGGADEAWDWALGRLRVYRDAGVTDMHLLRLQINVVEVLNAQYAEHVEDYLEATGNNLAIVMVCNKYLDQGKPNEAKKVTEPYLRYLEDHPELFEDGHLELQTGTDRAIYKEFHGSVPDERIRNDGIVLFLLMNQQRKRSVLISGPEEMDRTNRDTERWMTAAAKLSPCDAQVWLELARARSSGDTPAFRSTIRRAMQYAKDEPTLGRAYAELAMSRLAKEPQLASALCTMAQVYGEMAIAPRYLMSKLGVPAVPRPTAEKTVEAAGIQIGLDPRIREILKRTKEN